MANDSYTFIIMNNDDGEDVLMREEVSKEELIGELLEDIESNLSDWAFWDLDEDSIKKNEDKILNLIGEVKELLREI